MNDTNTDETAGPSAGVPTELWNQKNRKLNDLLDDLRDLNCVVSADGYVKCEPSGRARITGDVTLDAREVWGDFTLILLSREPSIEVTNLSSTDELVQSKTSDRMETTTRVTVQFLESLR